MYQLRNSDNFIILIAAFCSLIYILVSLESNGYLPVPFFYDKFDTFMDFITPPDFYNLIQAIIDFKLINTALDCYTKSPIAKFDLLDELKSEFGLKYEIIKNVNIVNATGCKLNYYSINKLTDSLRYFPKYTSKSAILKEARILLTH